MKKRIALDMDEVIADVTPKFLDLYEEAYGRRLEPGDFWGKKIYDLHEDAYVLRDRLHDKGFFRDLPVMPDSQEVVRRLCEDYDVFITTAAMEFRSSFEDKFDWLADHFPFIHWKNIVFCGDKSIIKADYMIDNHVKNLLNFDGKGLLFTASHNAEETRFTRVNNWREVEGFFYEREDERVRG